MDGSIVPARVFKTAWFSRAARKARIADTELCAAMRAVMRGQADDLGGGVFKKRLDQNRQRSIIVAKGRRYWVYAYLFAKQDRANITEDELAGFRALADIYAQKHDVEIERELLAKELMEICHGEEAGI
ncbi:type II toxin-antitoxin system RelE/ParE family toxin [Niveispirillum sp.]|uniref:type II toxin-antitoxin system RelE/ParE family toxin n=1 Tax=Niveispirillum sp. TaxID=1917217 RepID=UPI001B5DBEE9|nr:type II toxin-antitoxin system RelE/ParE family toxin [Niveispirillum sp.]MBP7337357.1 type II toxin-antitoxin system RelE/ParE family toxin [Niveispirillum sp.]